MGHPTMQENDTAKLTPTVSITEGIFKICIRARYKLSMALYKGYQH